MKRVAIVVERAPGEPFGLAVASERIARQAASRGEEVHVIAWFKDSAPGACISQQGAEFWLHRVGRLPKIEDALHALTDHVSDIVRRHEISLVHGIYAVHAGYAATLSAAYNRVPSIVSIRGNDLDRGLFRVDQLPFLSHALRTATRATAVSRELCQKAEGAFGRGVVHVTNSVDAEQFRPEARDNSLAASLGIGDAQVLGFVGELREKKGMRFLLPAFAELSRRQNVRLLLIGGARAEAREALDVFRASAKQASERIIELDYARSPKRLSRLFALCDAMVFPSLYEGLPNAMLEVMACARPVLATDVGGHRDLISHGETGALIALHDLDCLPDALEELLRLPLEKRTALGENARRFVLEHHRCEDESNAYARIYDEARRELLQSSP